MLAQLSTPDMSLPIQYSLTYPDRFPALDLARGAGEAGGTLAAVLNAANEVAVDAFVNRRISFPEISALVRRIMDRHQTVPHPTLKQILAADAWERAEAARG
jgi:1-deoxy-D-xylulose-5-phosphate reductoisomerase